MYVRRRGMCPICGVLYFTILLHRAKCDRPLWLSKVQRSTRTRTHIHGWRGVNFVFFRLATIIKWTFIIIIYECKVTLFLSIPLSIANCVSASAPLSIYLSSFLPFLPINIHNAISLLYYSSIKVIRFEC